MTLVDLCLLRHPAYFARFLECTVIIFCSFVIFFYLFSNGSNFETWLGIYHKALTIILNSVFWKRCRTSMFELPAVSNRCTPYVRTGFIKVFWRNLYSLGHLRSPSEHSLRIPKLMSKLLIFYCYVFSLGKTRACHGNI